MPRRLLHKAQVLKVSQKGSHSTQTWISYKSLKPHKVVLRRAHKGLEMSMFRGWHQHPPKEGGGSFYTCPQKLAIGN
jgi:hypothetical protein